MSFNLIKEKRRQVHPALILVNNHAEFYVPVHTAHSAQLTLGIHGLYPFT